MTKKVAVKIITITSSESEALDGKVFTSWNEANKITEKVADTHEGHCAKTWFTVEWQDGTEYSGRIDIEKYTERTIGEHIRKYNQYHSECPEWKNEADWLAEMEYHTEGTLEEITSKSKMFLTTYALEDVDATKADDLQLTITKQLLNAGRSTTQIVNVLQNSFNLDSLEAHSLIIKATLGNDNKIANSPKLRQATKHDLRKGKIITDPKTGEKAKLIKKASNGVWVIKVLDTNETMFMPSDFITHFQVEDKPRKQSKPRQTTFQKWFDTLIKEKGIDTELMFEVEGPEYGTNFFTVQNIIETIKNAPKNEQKGIKDMLVKIDFKNGDIVNYFKHLAKQVAL